MTTEMKQVRNHYHPPFSPVAQAAMVKLMRTIKEINHKINGRVCFSSDLNWKLLHTHRPLRGQMPNSSPEERISEFSRETTEDSVDLVKKLGTVSGFTNPLQECCQSVALKLKNFLKFYKLTTMIIITELPQLLQDLWLRLNFQKVERN